MSVAVKYIERTCLDYDAYIKLVKKFCSNLEYDIVISFDLRIKDYGCYTYDSLRKRHIIKISPIECGYDGKVKLGYDATKYNLISTTLHEIKHAIQREDLGSAFWSKKYSYAKDIKNPNMSDFYSISEVEARVFENKNIISAVQFYDSLI